MYDPKWTRWIVASIYKHFDLRKATEEIPTWFEGDDLSAVDGAPMHVEVRVDGPRYKELSKDYHRFTIDVGIHCVTIGSDDIYAIDRLIGIYQNLMTPIDVREYGDGEAYLGCLELNPEVDPSIDVLKYGQTDPNLKKMEASVEGSYRLELIL